MICKDCRMSWLERFLFVHITFRYEATSSMDWVCGVWEEGVGRGGVLVFQTLCGL